MITAAIFLLFAAQAATDSDLPKYVVEGTPEQGLRFRVGPFSRDKGARVEAEIVAEAQRRCGEKIAYRNSYVVQEGEIAVGGRSVPGVVEYRRDFLCIDPVEMGQRAPSDFKPTAEDEAAVEVAFDQYFTSYDAGDVAAVQAMGNPPRIDDRQVIESMRTFKEQFGTGKRTPYKMDWQINPPEKLHYGIFVDVHYYMSLDRGITICGLALFYRADAKTYRMDRDLMRPIKTPSSGSAGACSS